MANLLITKSYYQFQSAFIQLDAGSDVFWIPTNDGLEYTVTDASVEPGQPVQWVVDNSANVSLVNADTISPTVIFPPGFFENKVVLRLYAVNNPNQYSIKEITTRLGEDLPLRIRTKGNVTFGTIEVEFALPAHYPQQYQYWDGVNENIVFQIVDNGSSFYQVNEVISATRQVEVEPDTNNTITTEKNGSIIWGWNKVPWESKKLFVKENLLANCIAYPNIPSYTFTPSTNYTWYIYTTNEEIDEQVPNRCDVHYNLEYTYAPGVYTFSTYTLPEEVSDTLELLQLESRNLTTTYVYTPRTYSNFYSNTLPI